MEAHEKQNFSGMFVLSGLIIALMLAMSAAVWLQLPPGAEIPVHWNALGQVDRYGGKFEGALLAFFLLVHGGIMATVLGYAFNLTAWVMATAGLIFIIMGNFMGQIRQNNLFGIRTPWTLKSKLSWDKTHQLGSKLFICTLNKTFSNKGVVSSWRDETAANRLSEGGNPAERLSRKDI